MLSADKRLQAVYLG